MKTYSEPELAMIRHLRETVTSRVEKTSLRGVAREIGMSPTGVTKFILGTTPYSPTLRRLRKWYLQYGAVQVNQVGLEDASAALAILTQDLLTSAKRVAVNNVLNVIAQGYDQSGKLRPRWINDLREGWK